MIEEYIKKVLAGHDLESAEMEKAVSFIAQGKVPGKEIADFLLGLANKKETADEITGAAIALRRFVKPIHVKKDVILDTCGTGGDQKHTFNVSTVSAFVVAGAGITVAKHGNRSVSSLCGSADILEAFGVNISAPIEIVEKCINEIGIGFLYAPDLHPAFAHVQSVRKALKIRTIFNLMGPLINPAFPTHQLVGIFSEELVGVVSQVLKNLGLKHSIVACGEGGLDEVSTTGKTFISEMSSGHIKDYILEPEKMGVARVSLDAIRGDSVETNKQIASGVLKGMEGPSRDIVLLNAGCAIYLAGKANTIKEGMQIAAESIDSGAAIKKLNKLIEYTSC